MRNLGHCFEELAVNLRRNWLMNFTAVSMVMTSFCILGGFVLIISNLNQLSKRLLHEFEIRAFLAEDLGGEEVFRLKLDILDLPNVDEVRLVSKEEAWRNFSRHLAGKVDLSDISENPLRDGLVIRVKDPRYIKGVVQKISGWAGIERIVYGGGVLKRVLAIEGVFKLAGLIIGGLLVLSTVLIVYNTIRLTIFTRRRELRIMQLVGATDRFIRVPFILEGVFYGFLGAVLACLLIFSVYTYFYYRVAQALPFSPLIYNGKFLFNLCSVLIVSGMFAGGMASFFSVRRFLGGYR